MLPRIPFDAFVLGAVMREIEPLVGARVQKVWMPDPASLAIELYAGAVAWLWIGWDTEFPRMYVSPRKPPSMGESPAFCMALRSRLENRLLEGASQVDGDRLAVLRIGGFDLVVELFGKHANVVLLEPNRKVIAAARQMGSNRSNRPIQVNRTYEPPATRPDDSPFYKRLIAAGADGTPRPVFAAGFGAYPASVEALGYSEVKRDSISVALANYFDVAIPQRDLERGKANLRVQLERVLLAREAAVDDLSQALVQAAKADDRQRMAELILAYQGQIQLGDSMVRVLDYDGAERDIPLNPELSPLENAQALFDKAKRAKNRRGFVADQLEKQRAERDDLSSMLAKLEEADRKGVEALRQEADRRRWTMLQRLPEKSAAHPFGGKRIRELIAPGGWSIFVGENAEANDHLTLRVAKPDDWWLHVRGAASAHVVVPTKRKPAEVPREVLEFAAKVAVKHSGQKHASYVPVDYTLKRYVRKVRGSPPGTVLYTHEKTLHVDVGG